ncbi:MAG: response regulator transcription factor [Acidobacteriaceae bacterium]
MTNEAKAQVGVVTSDPLRSMGLVAILEETAGRVAYPLKLEQVFGEQVLDLVLLDIQESLEGILYTITRIRRERPALKPVVMGDPLTPEQIQAVIGAGAKGFLLRSAGVSEITMAIEIVLDGSIWAPRKVLARLVEAGTAGAENIGPPPVRQESIEEMITGREREVLHLLMNGRSNREIAAAMGIEQATVKAHLGRMLRKTRAKNRVELTLRAMEEREREDE